MNSYIDIKHLVAQSPRIKISVVTETYPPDVNGVAHTLSKIVDGLVNRGHAITLIRPRHSKDETPHQNQGFQEKLVKGLPIPFYKHLKMGLPSKRELIRLWSFDRPDIVHIATEGPLGWSALQAAKKLRLPVSTDFRTNFHAYSTHYKIGWLSSAILAYLKKFHNSASLTLVPTRQLQNELSGYGFINLKIIPRGIDTHQFNPRKRNLELRKSWGANEATKVLIYVGRLAAEKNLSTIFDAYHSAKRIEPNTKLVLVGDGPLRHELMAEHPEVIFSGFQKGRELAEHYASGDIFLFASQTETFGNVTLEAMASGLAVVAYPLAAAAELIQSGHNGMLAMDQGGLYFEMAVQALINQPMLVEKIKLNAANVGENYSWESILNQTESSFIDIIEGHKVRLINPVDIKTVSVT
jgi:glycosyltransferase involved in cell wall biosynthesis